MTRSQGPASPRARDDGLRRIRKLTWRIGLAAAAAAAVIGARFAHLTVPHLPHLTDQSGSSSQGVSNGGSPSQVVQPASGAGQAVSGGS